MLDLVSARAPVETVTPPPGPTAPRAPVLPSLLATERRNPRLSASPRPARPAETVAPELPARAQTATSPVPPRPLRQSLGDRIADLMQTEVRAADVRNRTALQASEEPGRHRETEPAAPAPHSSEKAEAPQPRPEAPQPQPEAQFRNPAPEPELYGDGYEPEPAGAAWYPSARTEWQDEPGRPLLDPSILFSAVWRHRRLIGLATVLGAGAGVLLALSTPHKYYAETRLFIDPREIQVLADDLRNQMMSTEAMIAITDSQVQILSSTSVLSKVVDQLGLARDPEFNGQMKSGGLSAGIALIKDLISKSESGAEMDQEALDRLRSAVSVSRDAKTFIINVGVQSRDPEKSALIANQVVQTYLDGEGQAQSGLMERTTDSLNTRIDAMRTDLDQAERAVETFKAENDIVGVAGELIGDKPILALSDQLAAARSQKVGIKVKAENLARVNLDDVISGAFPEEVLSSTILDLRKQYSQTKANADSLATSLGPLHPQFIAAQSSLEAIRGEIRNELRRIVASSQTELQRAVQTEQDLASQMAVAKTQSLDKSVEYVTLRELERKATATREIYEAFLKRSRETSERGNLSTRNIRVISEAEPPLDPMGPSRKIMVVASAFAGMFAGFGLSLVAGSVESIRSYNAATAQGRLQQQPFQRYPGNPSGPQPGPGDDQPPSGGRRRRSEEARDDDARHGRTDDDRRDDARHRRHDEPRNEDERRGLNAEEAALIHAEVMAAAAAKANAAALARMRQAESEARVEPERQQSTAEHLADSAAHARPRAEAPADAAPVAREPVAVVEMPPIRTAAPEPRPAPAHDRIEPAAAAPATSALAAVAPAAAQATAGHPETQRDRDDDNSGLMQVMRSRSSAARAYQARRSPPYAAPVHEPQQGWSAPLMPAMMMPQSPYAYPQPFAAPYQGQPQAYAHGQPMAQQFMPVIGHPQFAPQMHPSWPQHPGYMAPQGFAPQHPHAPQPNWSQQFAAPPLPQQASWPDVTEHQAAPTREMRSPADVATEAWSSPRSEAPADVAQPAPRPDSVRAERHAPDFPDPATAPRMDPVRIVEDSSSEADAIDRIRRELLDLRTRIARDSGRKRA